MIDIQTIGVWGFYGAALGVRRSFRTLDKMDSENWRYEGPEDRYIPEKLGEHDLGLMSKLVLRGNDEAKFARAIHVQANIKAPLYWWKQFDTYKVGTVRLSDSTMHNILKDPITEENFSASCVMESPLGLSFAGKATSRTAFCLTIQTLEMLRIAWWQLKNTVYDKEYIDTYGQEAFDKAVAERKSHMDLIWKQIIEMLPDSYLMESTIDLNYQVIRGAYMSREGHKLEEWQAFRSWAETLPYASDLICAKGWQFGKALDIKELERLKKNVDVKVESEEVEN